MCDGDNVVIFKLFYFDLVVYGMVLGNIFFFVEVFCLCKQFSFSVGQYFVYMFEYFVVVVWVFVVRFQVFFVEINEVMIVYEMDYDIFGFNMDGRVYVVVVICF